MSIDDNDVINQLTLLGLNPREAKVYVALLRIPEAKPAELGRISGIPRTKIYEVLAQMVTKGICTERQEGNKKFYRATRPRELSDQLQLNWKQERETWLEQRNAWEMKQRAKWEMEQRTKWEKKRETWEADRAKWEKEHADRRANATEIFVSLDKFFKSSSDMMPSLEKVETIHSKEQIILKFGKLMSGTKNEVLGFTRSPYAAHDDAARVKQVEVQEKILSRGVTIKSLYMDEQEEHNWMASFIGNLCAAGEEIRMVDDLPIKMFIFDRKAVLISLPSVPGLTGGDFTMLCVQDEGFIRACVILFETMWDRGTAVEDWLKKYNLTQ